MKWIRAKIASKGQVTLPKALRDSLGVNEGDQVEFPVERLMIAFNTNDFVRHLLRDDPRQCRAVSTVLRSESKRGRPIMLYDIVLCKTLWILETAYGTTRTALLAALEALSEKPVFRFEHLARVHTATQRFEVGKADFPDYLILEIAKEQKETLRTFDKKLAAELAADL